VVPFGILETLSRHSGYCFVSSRVARRAPGGGAEFGPYPIAWLVGTDELNSDDTNYWIFFRTRASPAVRAGRWDICDYASFGNCADSDPVTPEGDERAWCLLRSKRTQQVDWGIQLLSGWYAPEGGWRWTQKRFSIALNGAAGRVVELSFWIAPQTADALGPIRLNAWCGGASLAEQSFSAAGSHQFRVRLPLDYPVPLQIDFVCDKAVAQPADDRELALAVTRVSLA